MVSVSPNISRDSRDWGTIYFSILPPFKMLFKSQYLGLCPYFWPQFYIMVLGMIFFFFFDSNLLFPIVIWTFSPFSIWTFRFLFNLDLLFWTFFFNSFSIFCSFCSFFYFLFIILRSDFGFLPNFAINNKVTIHWGKWIELIVHFNEVFSN